MRKLPVFDESGFKVGEFIPEGSGAGAGFLLGLSLLIIFGVGWLIWMFFKLIQNGFIQAGKGNWSSAFGYWLLPILLITIPLITLIVSNNKYMTEQEQIRIETQSFENEVEYLKVNFPASINVTREPCTGEEGEYFNAISEGVEPCILVNIKNNWDSEIKVAIVSFTGSAGSDSIDYRGRRANISAGSNITLQYAPSLSRTDERRTMTNGITRVCAQFLVGGGDRDPKHPYLFLHSFYTSNFCDDVN